MSTVSEPSRAGTRQTKPPVIPEEWKIELPDQGQASDSQFGGCRSIESGYQRQFVLGQGTYGEVCDCLLGGVGGLGMGVCGVRGWQGGMDGWRCRMPACH